MDIFLVCTDRWRFSRECRDNHEQLSGETYYLYLAREARAEIGFTGRGPNDSSPRVNFRTVEMNRLLSGSVCPLTGRSSHTPMKNSHGYHIALSGTVILE